MTKSTVFSNDSAEVNVSSGGGFSAVKKALSRRTVKAVLLIVLVLTALVARSLYNVSTGQGPGKILLTQSNQSEHPLNSKYKEVGPVSEAEAEEAQAAKEQFNNQIANNTPANESALPMFVVADELDIDDQKEINRPEIDSEIKELNLNPAPPLELKFEAEEGPFKIRKQKGGNREEDLQKKIIKKLLSRQSSFTPTLFKTTEPETDEKPKEEPGSVIGDQEKLASTVEVVGEMELVAAEASLAMSSYYPGAVQFKLISGDPILNGAKLSGHMIEYEPAAKTADPLIQVKLDRMCLADGDCLDIQAVAFDPYTSQFAFASEIDRHIIARYGFWGLGTLLASAGKAIQLGATATKFQEGAIVQDSTINPTEEVIVALGLLAEQGGDLLTQYLNDPPEVKVHQYERVGVYFQKAVTLTLDKE